jgi:hypothetical protein
LPARSCRVGVPISGNAYFDIGRCAFDALFDSDPIRTILKALGVRLEGVRCVRLANFASVQLFATLSPLSMKLWTTRVYLKNQTSASRTSRQVGARTRKATGTSTQRFFRYPHRWDKVSVTDDFEELGGDSLIAVTHTERVPEPGMNSSMLVLRQEFLSLGDYVAPRMSTEHSSAPPTFSVATAVVTAPIASHRGREMRPTAGFLTVPCT